MTAEDYFATAIRLTTAANSLAIAGFLRAARGTVVSRGALATAVERNGASARLMCDRVQGQYHLVEIEWRLGTNDLDRFPHTGQSGSTDETGCPAQDPIRID